jgi:hypothetical protein
LAKKSVVVTEKPGQTITDDEFKTTIKEAGFVTKAITRSPLTMAETKTLMGKDHGHVAQASTTKPSTVATK